MKKVFAKMPKTIWALGFVSLLMDISSEIVHGLLPVFLISVLGASYTMVGLIEGFGEASTLVIKVFSGPLSDWLGKRKPLVLIGYTMGALSKPLFAIALNPGMVFGARLFDRVGKGIRGAPRDALIADVATAEVRGQAFGLRQSLDTVGAFFGPLLAILLMAAFNGNYRIVFWLATIPGVLCVLLILFGVKEPELKETESEKKLHFGVVFQFGSSFWFVAIAGAFFQLSRFSEAFLILRAENVGLSLAWTPLVLVAMNVVYGLSAYPVGWLSDQLQRGWFIIMGSIILIAANAFLGFGNSLTSIFIGVSLWGLHMGLTQGVLAALVADTCPPSYRGTAFGVFNLFSAVALLLASAVAGFLWDSYGPTFMFAISGSFAFIGLVVLLFSRKTWSLKI